MKIASFRRRRHLVPRPEGLIFLNESHDKSVLRIHDAGTSMEGRAA